jgi:hypothetical protein
MGVLVELNTGVNRRFQSTQIAEVQAHLSMLAVVDACDGLCDTLGLALRFSCVCGKSI